MAALPQYDFYDEMMRRVPTLRKQVEPGEASPMQKISGRAAARRVGSCPKTPAAPLSPAQGDQRTRCMGI
jgi:hypothetical protein